CVVLSPSGMITLSIEWPSRVTRRSLRVPSREAWTSASSSEPIAAAAANAARASLPRSVISSKPRAPLPCTQRQACSPRNRGQPCATANASASASVIARRSGRVTPLASTPGGPGLPDRDRDLGVEAVDELQGLERWLHDPADAG